MNFEYERVLLGSWLQGDHLSDMDKFEPSDFKTYPQLFSSIMEHGCRNIAAILRSSGLSPDELGNVIAGYQPTFYSSMCRELFEEKAREYLASVSPDTPLEEIITTLQGFVSQDFVELPKAAGAEACSDYVGELDSRKAREIVRAGINGLDNLLWGIRTKELTSVGARPAVGKSAFTLQVALNVARQGRRVLYFPLEMSTAQTIERCVLSSKGDKGFHVAISHQELRSGALTRSHWEGINRAIDEPYRLIQGAAFQVYEGINDISVIHGLVKAHRPYLVVIDQLEQLTADRKFKDKRERFSYMTNTLKRISMTEDVAVWLACQINRSAEETAPTMANLKESGSIEEDSDNVILLHRVAEKHISGNSAYCGISWNNSLRPVDIAVTKQRSGATGTVKTKFIANHFTFEEVRR